MVRFQVDIADAHAHLFRVTLTLPRPDAEQDFSLPVWIAGSYMVRDFSKHLSEMTAQQAGEVLPVLALDKRRWRVHCKGASALTLSYLVYAKDVSVRGAFLDADRGFFNGTSLLLCAEGRRDAPHELSMGVLPEGWAVATAMAPHGHHHYRATSYDELVDHPVELGRFWRGSFHVRGALHEVVVSGAWPSFDGDRLLQDMRRICEHQIAFWHGVEDAPFKRYVFLLCAVDEGFGGLEHRASTALMAARRDLPRRRMDSLPDGYVTLLSLISHEYFHTWNVKRLRPRDLDPIDPSRENETRLLWFFEGFTSYYDDLALLRTGLIDLERYLKLLSKCVQAVAATPGRHVHSVAEASFEAWTKFYKGDENTPNITVNYYQKGALLGLAFDLSLRRDGSSLDALMRELWRVSQGGPIDEADIAQALQKVAGRSYHAELASWVHGTEELPLSELLADLGIHWRQERAGLGAALGLRVSEGALTGVQVKAVLRGGAAAAAGVSAGDELLAVDGWRLRRLDDAAQWIEPGQPFQLLVSRDQRVLTLTVQPQANSPFSALAALHQAAPLGGDETAARRRAWLGA
jgi:predicted metalloprotease with PDZ domain